MNKAMVDAANKLRGAERMTGRTIPALRAQAKKKRRGGRRKKCS
jgi:hypothetical protein